MRVDIPVIRRILNGATIALVAIGVFFWLAPARIPRADIPPALRAPDNVRGGQPRVNSSTDATAIVSFNMFSATRAAPPTRYTPPGAGGSRTDATESPMQNESAAPLAAPPRVYGTMTGPNGATALIEGDSAGSSSRIYHEGDRVGPFRIVKILASSVIVAGPSGRIALKVEQREDPR